MDNGSDAAATGNVAGPGPVACPSYGVALGCTGTAGSVGGHAIAHVFGSRPGDAARGIPVTGVVDDATPGTNTSPDPPGNTQDVCDNRSSASEAGSLRYA